MESRPDIHKKLLDSDAAKSLLQEMEISSVVKSLGWSVTDNPYYEDQTTQKFREIDLFGRLSCEIDKPRLYLDVQLIIESKSIKDYHVIFSNQDRFFSCDVDSFWIGDEFYFSKYIRQDLLRVGFSEEEIEYFTARINKDYYPSKSWIFSKYLPSFFQNLSCFYSFRETNTKNTKELNNSVVWKVFLELLSVNQSISARQRNNFLEDVQFQSQNNELKEDRFEEIYSSMKTYLDQIDLIYPILVTDCALWELHKNATIEEIGYARLMQTDLFGSTSFWIDVVNKNHFKEYMQKLTEHITLKCKSLGALDLREKYQTD